jgi:hypothetical protein
MTLHPEGKAGVNINKEKYDKIRNEIIHTLKKKGPMTFRELGDEVSKRLKNRFEGSISWYYTTVKLDLEAREIIARILSSKPQRIKLL